MIHLLPEIKAPVITPGGRAGDDARHGSSTNGRNWVERSPAGELPDYIRIVRNGLMKSGHSEGSATALAVAAMKRWASGGDNVSPKVRAAAAKALAQWEAMKGSAHAKFLHTDREVKADGGSHSVPSAVKAEAQRALDWSKDGNSGGTSVGMATARALVSGSVSSAKVRHIARYFPRHEVDKSGKGWSQGDEGYPSNGRVAWALWGGDAGRSWANGIVKSLDSESKSKEFAASEWHSAGADQMCSRWGCGRKAVKSRTTGQGEMGACTAHYNEMRKTKSFHTANFEVKRQRPQSEIDAMGAKGQAYKTQSNGYSYPIADEADLGNAIQAFGRAAEEDKPGLKRYIKRRARALGKADSIPDTWGSKAAAFNSDLHPRGQTGQSNGGKFVSSNSTGSQPKKTPEKQGAVIPKNEQGSKPGTYKIQQGDTLSALAKKFGTTVDGLMKDNPQIKNPNLIYTGADLHIPGAKPEKTSTTSSSHSSGGGSSHSGGSDAVTTKPKPRTHRKPRLTGDTVAAPRPRRHHPRRKPRPDTLGRR